MGMISGSKSKMSVQPSTFDIRENATANTVELAHMTVSNEENQREIKALKVDESTIEDELIAGLHDTSIDDGRKEGLEWRIPKQRKPLLLGALLMDGASDIHSDSLS